MEKSYNNSGKHERLDPHLKKMVSKKLAVARAAVHDRRDTPDAQCPIPNAQCPTPYAPMPSTLHPMPSTLYLVPYNPMPYNPMPYNPMP